MLIGGIDEVGRGALAGPIMAAVAVFHADMEVCPLVEVRDSKAFPTPNARVVVFHKLMEAHWLWEFGVGLVDHTEIDAKGIDWANAEVFRRALADLRRYQPDKLIVDGNHRVHSFHGPQIVEAKADRNYWQVGAASIVAKVIRDRHMYDLARACPHYDWEHNVGYGTDKHKAGLALHGLSLYHRRSFCKRVPLPATAWAHS